MFVWGDIIFMSVCESYKLFRKKIIEKQRKTIYGTWYDFALRVVMHTCIYCANGYKIDSTDYLFS